MYSVSVSLFAENWVPHYGVGNNFFAMFALFFPSVTGIQTGANISGDLKVSILINKTFFEYLLFRSIKNKGKLFVK